MQRFDMMFFRPKALIGLLFAAVFALPATAHNVYASFTRVDWNGDDHSVELVIQLHGHELEDRLSLDMGERLSFLEDADIPKLEKAVGPWTLENLAVSVDGTPLPLTYLGMEIKGQEILLYLEADWPTVPKHLTVRNSMFLADLPGQVNTVMGVVNGIRKAGEMRADSDPIEMEF